MKKEQMKELFEAFKASNCIKGISAYRKDKIDFTINSLPEYFVVRRQANYKLKKQIQKLHPEWEEKYTLFCENQKEISISIQYDLGFKQAVNLIEKANKIARCFIGQTSYSMGEYIKVSTNKREIGFYNNCSNYAGNKYKATHGEININFNSVNELKKCENIEGLWTVPLKDGKAKWIKTSGSKQNFECYWENGFLYKESHSTKSFLDAKHIQKRKEIARCRKEQEIAKFKYRFLGAEHLRTIGACNAGIQNAAKQLGIDLEKIGGVRVDYLLEKAERNGYFMNYIKAVVNNKFRIW